MSRSRLDLALEPGVATRLGGAPAAEDVVVQESTSPDVAGSTMEMTPAAPRRRSRKRAGGLRSTRTMVVATMLVVSLVPMVGVLYVFSQQQSTVATEAAKAKVEGILEAQVARLSDQVADQIHDLAVLRSLPTIIRELDFHQQDASGFDGFLLTATLVAARDASPELVRISAVGSDGIVFASTDPSQVQVDMTGDDYVTQGRVGVRASDLSLDDNGALTHRIVGPVITATGAAGTLVATLRPEQLLDIVADYTGLGETGETVVASAHVSGQAQFITSLRFDADAAFSLSSAEPILLGLSGQHRVLDNVVDYRGQQVIAATGYVPLSELGVVVKVDRSEALGSLHDFRRGVVLSIIGIGLLVIILAWVGSGWIVRPISKLTIAAHEISGGNLDSRTDISAPSDVAMLGAAFNEMAEQLAAKRAELEWRVERRTVQLEASNRDLESYAEVAAHDLASPLRKMRLMADLIMSAEDNSIDDETRTRFEVVIRAADRMQSILDGLMELSRVSDLAGNRVPVDLNEVTAQVVSDFADAIAEVGGRVEVDQLPTMVGDPGQLAQLLQNLIGNGLKFRRPDEPPVVRVSARSAREADLGPGAAWAVVIEDNGTGFNPVRAADIFGTFVRLQSSIEGSGLGLATCRRIVEGFGGTISATSEPGAGSTFVFTVPADRIVP